MIRDIYLQIQESILKQDKWEEMVFPRFQFNLLDVEHGFLSFLLHSNNWKRKIFLRLAIHPFNLRWSTKYGNRLKGTNQGTAVVKGSGKISGSRESRRPEHQRQRGTLLFFPSQQHMAERLTPDGHYHRCRRRPLQDKCSCKSTFGNIRRTENSTISTILSFRKQRFLC